MSANFSEVIIIGAGAAGLFCAAHIAKSGKHVTLLDNGKKIGRKILMSGGGFCNFTNLEIHASRYICHNEHFVKSALARYSQWDFIELVTQYGIAYHEKEAGQLFCDKGAEDIVDMLQQECDKYRVSIYLRQQISQVEKIEQGFLLQSNGQLWQCRSLVIASGGLSMPGLGATPFGYRLAEQFGINVIAPRAGLVPFTYRETDKHLAMLAGIALPVNVCTQNGMTFKHNMLFTHRGISGPAILQISNYWQSNEYITIDLLPNNHVIDYLQQLRRTSPKLQLKNALNRLLPKKLTELWFEYYRLKDQALAELSNADFKNLAAYFHQWQFQPNGTEGYRTAEVTLGGIDTHEISSKTMESNKIKGLYFIGEVLDVTGWLGGYNFQWAWSSAYVCADAIIKQ